MANDNHTIVPHPRFGDTPIPSGDEKAVALTKRHLPSWRYRGVLFPESAIMADPSKQNYTVVPRKIYVDMQRSCERCGRDFIFFAKEQQFWYEELKFFVDSECVQCPECRKAERTLSRRYIRYGQNAHATNLDVESFITLLDDAMFLWENGLLKNEQELNRLKNLARSRIPDHEITGKLEAFIGVLRVKKA